MKVQFSIEQFRKFVYPQLIEKSVMPPKIGSKKEVELFNEWVKGRNKLTNNTNGRTTTGSK